MSYLKSIGADVELFAFDKVNNTHKSLCVLIGGTKEKQMQIKELPLGFALQEDNVSVEYNIPSCSTGTSWRQSHEAVLSHINKLLLKKGFRISKDASASFIDTELTHPNALVFGCEPDYNAWSKMENSKPQCDDKNLRTAGGHIHVGTDMNMLDGIKQMDLFLGIPSIILDSTPASQARRQLYGKAGAMRPKSYGFEYRVLSNFWIFNPELVDWAFQATRKAIQDPRKITNKQAKDIQHAINTGDQNAAKDIMSNYGLTLPLIA